MTTAKPLKGATLIKSPATCHKCNLRFIAPTTGVVLSKCYKCGEDITTDKNGETEALDLMRDEFIRIKNYTDNSEIKGLCDRAISGIEQHTPVLVQRDKYQADADRLWAQNYMLRQALEKVMDVLWQAEDALEHSPGADETQAMFAVRHLLDELDVEFGKGCRGFNDVPLTDAKTGRVLWGKQPCTAERLAGTRFCMMHQEQSKGQPSANKPPLGGETVAKNMNKPITHTHNGIVITYNEENNIWTFTLRNRDRRAESLAKAKEAIDKPVSEKAKPFTRIKAWRREYYSDFELGEVTSISDSHAYGGGMYVWFVANGNRTKVSSETVYPCTPSNDANIAKFIALGKEAEKIEEKRKAAIRNLKRLEIPNEE